MFTPLNDRIVVKRDAAKQYSDSGLHIPEDAREKPNKGTILAIGSEVKDVKVNDYIIFSKLSGTPQTYENEEVLIMRENEVWGILNVA